MTKSIKPGRLVVDWARLHELFNQVDTQRSTDELVPAWQREEIPEPRWAPEYLPALQRALEGADESMLIEILDARRLAHPQLMPLFAELLRRKAQGLSTGRGSALTEMQKQSIWKRYQDVPRGGRGTFKQELAEALGVSARTIENAIGEVAHRK